MRRPQNSAALSAATLLLALPSLVSSINLDCADVVVDGKRYDFSELGGPRSVHWIQDQPPSVVNTTFTLDICHNLKVVKGVGKADQCPLGTRVCGVEAIQNTVDNTTAISRVIPIAGNYASSSGGHLDPKWTKLKGSDSNADAEKEGLRLELKGGKYPINRKKNTTKQKALIEFVCDRNRTGTEGTELDGRDTEDDQEEEKRRRRLAKKLRAREEDEEGDDDDDDDDDDDGDDADKNKSLQFVSYKQEDDGLDVLRLTWYTKFACDDGGKSGSSPGKSEHWGFFTWMIIIVFLCTAAYLIFGSWLNYERYGARGWDAIPHGDTIRDIPYLIKDFGRRVTSSVQGGGSRGGYSAV
ncbi:type II membrane protein [Neofusicoccum ribis]|uniref:Autophagy-related protein 27 n=1 Tax=Neofusicoccum ribis TaxID=45134 RepID=A0ABR3TEI7_9PEZI